MENQGFEGEQQQSRHDSRALSFDPSRIEFFPDGSVSNADGHVYEDILPGVEAGIPFSRDHREPETNGPVDYASRDTTRSWDHEEICGGFRRNLTLPFRRGPGLEPSTATSSVRCTTNRSRDNGDYQEIAKVAAWNVGLVVDDAFSREIAARAQSTPLQAEGRPNRRRRKKDCKHCRSKVASSATNARECENDDRETETVSQKDTENECKQRTSDPRHSILVDPCSFSSLSERSSFMRNADDGAATRGNSSSVFTISEKVGRSATSSPSTIEGERNDGSANLVNATGTNVDNTLSASKEKSRAGIRVNSIYSQDRWYAKEAAIFVTDVKEHGNFQRAYSLPVRTQTPSSQNRINLRRSVRGEPPPHPARLRKHRHGWTLHLAHPLEASGCTRSLVVLLVALLVLLGIGALALYIALEPEKLQIIQQYLRSPTNESSSQQHTLAAGTLLYPSSDEQRNESSSTEWTTATTLPENGTLVVSDIGSPAATETKIEAEVSGPSSLGSSRHCDDCLTEEVCVALVDEGVPTCRIPLDPEDPTGCAGFCLINKQKCHRLDVDAFRCVEVEHYCLDDEWTCLNTLCIPLEKHCDGHMNCYDHSDEYSCACDLETHFHCGNETSCLPLDKRCDGKIDCWDAADEINCTLGRTLACPSENEFTCSSGQCILKARFCDGLPDCLDGSDEPHGCQGRCNKHEFTCQNTRCITKGMKCNGVDDCGDGTDERHCKDRFS